MESFFASNPREREKREVHFAKLKKEHPEFYRTWKGVTGKEHPTWKGGKKVVGSCKECGAKLYSRPYRAHLKKFCSRSCRSSWVSQNCRVGKGTHFTIEGEHYHSTYELRCVSALRKMGIKIVRNCDRFRYVWNKRSHFYTPDFKMFFPQTASFVYVEIKGWVRPVDLEKLKAVRSTGKEIWMLTDLGLSTLESEATNVS